MDIQPVTREFGLFLNSTIVVGIAVLYERSKGAAVNGNDLLSMFGAILMSQHNFHVPKPVLNGALLVATGVVVFWNYFANRFWTFRHIPPK
jgi:Ca2+/Na+ antiporter